MIFLPLEKTPEHKQLEVLVPRLSPHDPNYQILEEKHGRLSAGYYGESSLKYFLDLLDLSEACVLHGLRLSESKGTYFQIDVLILTQQFFLIIEVKHLKGTIRFNPSGQMIRTLSDGKNESFPHPLVQATVQKNYLHQFMLEHGFPLIPTFSIAAFSHPKVILDIEKNENIVDNQQLPERITAMLNTNRKCYYEQNKLIDFANFLCKSHCPRNDNIIKLYQIPEANIKNGVWCSTCKDAMMYHERGDWKCSVCEKKDGAAHLETLKEYGLIYKTWIKNSEARKFLGIKSLDIMKRLLHHKEITQSGKNKTTTYQLDLLLD
ncbi:hypothetical protein GCM10011351_21680 [Paraliobacillus quinghaiensis]|uniref:NERD domain-containing protein n=1 Tax=Paraliobacillus quinghaiensis TaxID=470815 RepID=A0A917TSR9_9BACI|nr:nuclease-related domain-containing protein [Paraliobacillus quinghaiensis]GGM35333.1 hypothetical protein GCM10011351_21680 [Paraliobacillus quinghaiensis]